ncbi:MAG TPA: Txe/YoeB family addiction module toxin [Thermoanaerobaculia bacterium]|nr:Txe/YoeB family addiction module toxin [Thermoanaerobaculia bacterium]
MSRSVARGRWRVVFTKQAQKDARKIDRVGLRPQAERLLELLAEDPYRSPPPFEKLVGDLAGAYSRRISIQHRLVYQISNGERTVKVLRMWTHYE